MFVLNDDLSIYATRGDIVFFSVCADEDGVPYTFKAGDVVRIKVYGKKDAENVILQKDFPVTEATESVEIFLSEEDTKMGEVISKPKDYWYEVELNPYNNPQTIIGYDEDGAKVFKLFPEGDDVPEFVPKPEDIAVMDDELDMTSTRPVQNQAIARAVTSLRADFEKTDALSNETAKALSMERERLDNLIAPDDVTSLSQNLEYLDFISMETQAKIDGTITSDGVFSTITVNLREANLVYGGTTMDMFVIPNECRPINTGVIHTEDGLEYIINYNNVEKHYYLSLRAQDSVAVAPSGAGSVTFTYALGDYELKDIRVGADGAIYGSAGTSVRAQFTNIGKRIDERRAEINSYLNKQGEMYSKSGTAFNGISPVAYVEYDAPKETTIHTYGENALPFDVIQIASFNESEVGENYAMAVLEPGMAYKFFTLKPIFLKAGTYKFGFDCLVNGVNAYDAAIKTCGVTYIYRVDEDKTETLVYACASYDNDCHTIRLDADSYYVFKPYFVVNKEITENTTVKICNIFISETATSYHEYEGETINTALGNGLLVGFPKMNIVSKETIDIRYSVSDEDNTVVACWGDSLTNGTGSTSGKPSKEENADCSYPGVLGRILGERYSVKNFGVGGETSWQIASRQGGMCMNVLPFTLPGDTSPVQVHLQGQEQNYFYDNKTQKWTYSKDNLSYNFEATERSGVNPCEIGGIKGTLERVRKDGAYEYYFTRQDPGVEQTYLTPQPLITHASKAYRNATHVIWAGQNDAPSHNGQYIMQIGFEDRMQTMIDNITSGKYIVMDYPSGTDADSAQRCQQMSQKFGKHYLNIREYIAKYGVNVANSNGAGIVLTEEDKANIAKGKIPSCLLSDSVHGNYWYYQVVAQAVNEKGKALGYW